jgi:hypothetical protein
MAVMDTHYPTIDEPATPEYVLAVIRNMHRQQCRYDPEADPGASLTFDSTVEEWRDACDLLGWRELGRAHNEFWGSRCPDDQWQAVLEPAREKRLADVCTFVASRARRPRIRPARLFGRTCRAAGAFLTVRSLLGEAGALAEGIAPSTPLAPYTRQYCGVFLTAISRLAPGELPPVRIHTPVYAAAIWGMFAGLACFVAGLCASLVGLRGCSLLFTGAGAAVFLVFYSLSWIAACAMLPASVEFGELRTFRDLAMVLAEECPDELGIARDGGRGT